MFISIEQLTQSLARLEKIHPFFGMSLLIFAREQIPVGKTKELVFARVATDMLETYYKAAPANGGYSGYYSPFLSNAGGGWLSGPFQK